MKRYTFNVDATSVSGSQTYYVDAESEDEAREQVEGGGGEFVCEELEVQDLGKFELVDIEDVPVELEASPDTPANHSAQTQTLRAVLQDILVAGAIKEDEYPLLMERAKAALDGGGV